MRSIAVALVAFLGLSLGCAAPPRPPAAAPPKPGEIVPRDEAAAIAQEAVDGRVTVLLHLDRMRSFRFARQLAQLGAWNILASDTGIDTFKDVERTFIAAHASHEGQVALVLQHSAPEEQVVAAIAALQEKWRASHPARPTQPGPSGAGAYPIKMRDLEARIDALSAPLPDPERFPFPAAYRHLKNDFTHTDGPVLIAAPHPGLVILLPPERAFAAFRMIEGGGLPAPAGREAMVFRAWDPERSIQSGPAWSPQVRYAEAEFTFDGTGAGALKFRAVCSSAAVAKQQAEVMTEQVEQAQTVSLGGAKLRLFDFIQFRAERDRVKMLTHLFAEDVEWLVGMSMKPL